ncbi:hypothetical protein C8F04DRAFT_1264697 [Mycena alexandri]|uniref:Uncharacterized protein n=1 Tax=Mycena alexandri TaxID=1745969 RepID=A0AAD6WY62_9AGAR|nr:hypothetical protein C8F04DRAFT_1264697 [Mycena alexandri]
MSLSEAPVKDALDAQRLSSPQAATNAPAAAARNLHRGATKLQHGERYEDFEANFVERSENNLMHIIYSYDIGCQYKPRCSCHKTSTQ